MFVTSLMLVFLVGDILPFYFLNELNPQTLTFFLSTIFNLGSNCKYGTVMATPLLIHMADICMSLLYAHSLAYQRWIKSDACHSSDSDRLLLTLPSLPSPLSTPLSSLIWVKSSANCLPSVFKLGGRAGQWQRRSLHTSLPCWLWFQLVSQRNRRSL